MGLVRGDGDALVGDWMEAQVAMLAFSDDDGAPIFFIQTPNIKDFSY